MPIQISDFKIRLSGGSANSTPASSLGGVKSVTEAQSSTLFSQITPSIAAAGLTDYRCVYLHNASSTNAMLDAKFWISTQTSSPDTSFEIGLGTSALNATEQTIATTTTAPVGVTFGGFSSEASALTLGDIPAGQHRAIWFKRIVNAGAAVFNDSVGVNATSNTAA